MGITDFFPDTSTFPENVYGFCQLIYIAATYLFVLMNASRMISHGSELLLLVPAVAGIVGSIILPIMSSVPDGALVIFSGLGDDAQEKLQVGVGSLAGATIMLLTVPWFIAVFIGRVDVDPSTGLANYTNKPKLSGQYNVMQTGVSITSAVRKRGYVLLITAIPYLIVQVPGMFYMNDTVEQQANGEKWYALAAFILCTIFFALYLLNEYMQSDEEASISYEIKLEYIREAINKQEITIIGVMAGLLEPHKKSSMSRSGKRCSLSDTLNRQVVNDLKSLLHPFFKLYDIDNSETLQIDELMFVFKDLGEKNMDRDDIEELWKDEVHTAH
jgi:Ca2+/Na+ antiporter